MKRLRHDLDHLTSAGLLVAVLATGFTGLIADLWDLNDFWYHTLSGYLMGALAAVHVWLNWGKLAAYARFRLARRPAVPAATPASGAAMRPTPTADRPAPARLARAAPAALTLLPEPINPLRTIGRMAVSRRGALALGVGGAAGLVLGRGLRPPPVIAQGSDVGVVYHQWSKPGVIDTLGSVANWGQQPPLYKKYPGARVIDLPKPSLQPGLPTEHAIALRRSVRDYSGEALTLAELGQLLFLASGIAAEEWGSPHRTAPSSGALYPIEIYPVVHNVTGVEPGIYHYAIEDHALELVRAGDFRETVVQQGLSQEYLGQCNVVLFLTQILQRMRFKYQDRSYRYGLLEAGHIGENVYLAATSMGLGACGIGAYMDDEINAMLGVDGVEEATVYMLAAGRKKV
jgi:SagB-type dehydrogenase family enzyme